MTEQNGPDADPAHADPAHADPAHTDPAHADRPDTDPPAADGPDSPGGGGGASEPGRPPSGLRNPAAAVRGVGMAALILECIVLLLSIQPIRMVAPHTPGWAYGVVVALAAGCLVVAALLRRPWGWGAGIPLQIAVVATGLLQYALFVLGVVFLLIWLYVLKVRRDVIGPSRTT
jgi:hypothetical protein